MEVKPGSALYNRLQDGYNKHNTVSITFSNAELYDLLKTIRELDEERSYNEYVQKNKLKGYVAGYQTRCTSFNFMANHCLAEDAEKTRTAIRKLANNPALSMEARKELDKASWMIVMYINYRQKYYDLRDMSLRLKRLEFKKTIATKKTAQD